MPSPNPVPLVTLDDPALMLGEPLLNEEHAKELLEEFETSADEIEGALKKVPFEERVSFLQGILAKLTAAEAKKKAEAAKSFFDRMLDRITSAPRAIVTEIAGWIGGFTFLTVGGLFAWNRGRDWYLRNVVQPAATMMVSATFPAAIVPSEILKFLITNPDLLSMAFTTIVMWNKSVAGKYYKEGREDFKDWARKTLNFGKKAPKKVHSLSWANIRFQLLDKVTDVLAVLPGFVKTFIGVVSVRAVSITLLKAFNRMPLISPLVDIAADLFGAALFAATVVIGKELPELLQKWGESFFKGVANDGFDAANGLANDGAGAVTNAATAAWDGVTGAAVALRDTTYDAGAYMVNTMTAPIRFMTGSTATAANQSYDAARKPADEVKPVVPSAPPSPVGLVLGAVG